MLEIGGRTYKVGRELGEGAYGVVFEGTDIETNEIVALKECNQDWDDESEGMPPTLLRELGILKLLNDSPYTVNLKNFSFYSVDGGTKKLWIVFEYHEMNLAEFIDTSKIVINPLQVNQIKTIMRMILLAVDHMHNNRIIHRDIKPENIFISPGIPSVVLGDFGLARSFTEKRSFKTGVVTLWYRAPELLMQVAPYTPAIDLWAVGCTFFELAEGMVCFKGDTEVKMQNRIFEKLGTPTPSSWPDLKRSTKMWNNIREFPVDAPIPPSQFCTRLDPCGLDLLYRLLDINPETRITAADALRHPFFD
ncbi:hypothetical protein PCE1_003868 [Barthelona sp. PCE]